VNGRPISTSDIILISYKNIGLIKYLMNNKQKFSNSDKKFYEYTKNPDKINPNKTTPMFKTAKL
jgi:hypothetical protein